MNTAMTVYTIGSGLFGLFLGCIWEANSRSNLIVKMNCWLMVFGAAFLLIRY
jgi:hypothetical protein